MNPTPLLAQVQEWRDKAERLAHKLATIGNDGPIPCSEGYGPVWKAHKKLLTHIRAAPVVGPPEASAGLLSVLPEDTPPRTRQAHDQCRAVIHMAKALAEVHEARATILAHDPMLTEVIGSSTAYLMEMLGDALSNMDAVDAEEDDWLDPVFEAAQMMWPTEPVAGPARSATKE